MKKDKSEEQRESIWSVKQENRYKFSIYFVIMFLAGAVFVCWYEIFHITEDDGPETVVDLIKDISMVGITTVTLIFFIFEGRDTMGVALEIFKRKRLEEGREEGRAERDAEIRKWYEAEKAKGNLSSISKPPPFLEQEEQKQER